MAAPVDRLSSSPLNDTVPSVTMPASSPSTRHTGSSANAEMQPMANSVNKVHSHKISQGKNIATQVAASPDAVASEARKLSGAELKKLKAAEKAARRKEKVAERETQEIIVAGHQDTIVTPKIRRQSSASKKDAAPFQASHKRTGSSGKSLPVRITPATASLEQEKAPQEEKRVTFLSHLYDRERRHGISCVGKEIHPAILTLGLQLRDHVICGGNARCAATLLAFKKVIQAYTTPPGIALSRHLTIHMSHQISHLSHSRPLSASQGNTIRWLKKLISSLDPDLSDSDAIAFLCKSIDGFIREKITFADEVIAREASGKIESGDVVLTHAKSSIVEKTLLAAHSQGKKFKVIVTDSRPLFEGKNLARSLSATGIETQYCSISGLSSIMWQVTKCFLGASAMMGNGRLYSRVGTALVAMAVKAGSAHSGRNPPVVVLCGSIKFTGRVTLDSIVSNELDSPETLVEHKESEVLTRVEPSLPPLGSKVGKKGDKNAADEPDSTETVNLQRGLEAWVEQPGLHLVSLMYDVTPAEYLDMVITELGTLPPSAVPVVNSVWGGES